MSCAGGTRSSTRRLGQKYYIILMYTIQYRIIDKKHFTFLRIMPIKNLFRSWVLKNATKNVILFAVKLYTGGY